ncbi:MAG TPA: peptide chain release factor N(5)-glutamine methyltransferase [Candidatus Obscuribacterales bacterium]
MATVHEAYRKLVSSLQAAGIEKPEAQRQADLIIEHATGWSKARQMAYPEAPLEDDAVAAIERIESERRKRVPLQYILGEQWFMGLAFKVRPGVLIPRPDTETLVEQAIKFLSTASSPTFVDIGTGSGAIAIAVLHALPDARAYALDISKAALATAAENAARHAVTPRLTLVEADWLSFQPQRPLHAVLCNPPYVPMSQASELEPEVAVFEPKEAIFGTDEDGLGFFRSLSTGAGRLLSPGGLIFLEVGRGQAEAVTSLFNNAGWGQVAVYSDLNGIARCISAAHALGAIGS